MDTGPLSAALDREGCRVEGKIQGKVGGDFVLQVG